MRATRRTPPRLRYDAASHTLSPETFLPPAFEHTLALFVIAGLAAGLAVLAVHGADSLAAALSAIVAAALFVPLAPTLLPTRFRLEIGPDGLVSHNLFTGTLRLAWSEIGRYRIVRHGRARFVAIVPRAPVSRAGIVPEPVPGVAATLPSLYGFEPDALIDRIETHRRMHLPRWPKSPLGASDASL
ncbi:MAG: hypothetical protein ACFBSD_12235 [Paracoccaceae bacterium]